MADVKKEYEVVFFRRTEKEDGEEAKQESFESYQYRLQSKRHRNMMESLSFFQKPFQGPKPKQPSTSTNLPSFENMECSPVVVPCFRRIETHSFAVMEEDGVEEVSFTSLATKTLGSCFGTFVAIVYASLSFLLLVACVSGIGSLVSQWFPWMNLVMAHALFPLAVGTVILFFPFKAINAANRFLCVIMLFSIAALVAIGLSVARKDLLGSFGYASWGFSSILPAIPVTVLTLGFHVVTPFICKIAGNTVKEARQAILVGGAVPLVMVLSWNLIVLGLAGTNRADLISLLLSVSLSALPAVQGFAFTALATSLIGYVVSFPKQLIGYLGVDFWESQFRKNRLALIHRWVLMRMELGELVLIASFFPSTFTRALDFAGVLLTVFCLAYSLLQWLTYSNLGKNSASADPLQTIGQERAMI
ncbi:hypothetical protein SO802_031724 [Lithocarpus litseifolius]|uniref:Uncharacterized protein n=1 Tax=Lithocarpus litseifolius TaxID=425828 RepID=A0AAW2BMQ1_9ROSI